MRPRLPAILTVAVVATALLLLLNWFAPLQAGTVAFYAGLLCAIAGLISLAWPLRRVAIHTRREALLVLVAGVTLAAVALWWPVDGRRSAVRTMRLDDVMPEYDFYERHVVDVHAPADRTMRALNDVTFDDVRTLETLMRIRTLNFRRGAGPTAGRQKMLETLAGPRSAFLRLAGSEREVVLGMAGRPWAASTAGRVRTAEDYAAFAAPGAVKIAMNLLVEDGAPGWSRVITETRIRGNDEAARRQMARYWRVIYPGSALIRKMWLAAIRDRAERPES